MKIKPTICFALLIFGITRGVFAADWITAPSYYTHDPMSGKRVTQYTQIGPFYTQARSDYTTSGYRHTRSSIQAGGSVDHLHLVEEWGRPVRPYDEWKYPYRPYSVPYQAWGPQPVPGGFFPYGYGGGAGLGGPAGPYGPGGFGGAGNAAREPWNTDHYRDSGRQNVVPFRVIDQTPLGVHGPPHGGGVPGGVPPKGQAGGFP